MDKQHKPLESIRKGMEHEINQVESWEMGQVRAGRMSPYLTGFGPSGLVFCFTFLVVFLTYKHFEAEYFFTQMKTVFPMITKPVRLLPNPTPYKKKKKKKGRE